MAFFDNFTDSLKQKWLEFFQMNHGWITRHMEVESVYTPDGGRRPPSYLILGVVNALEPKLAQLMLPFSRLNPDADTLIEVLELNFDPDLVLGNRISPIAEPELSQDTFQVSEIEVTDVVALDENTFGVVVALEPDELSDGLLGTNLDELDAAVPGEGGMSLHDFSDEIELEQFDNDESMVVLHAAETQAFGDLSFDEELTDETGLEEALPHESLETMHPPQAPLGDVLPDVWDEEALNRMGEAHEGTHPKTPRRGRDTIFAGRRRDFSSVPQFLITVVNHNSFEL